MSQIGQFLMLRVIVHCHNRMSCPTERMAPCKRCAAHAHRDLFPLGSTLGWSDPKPKPAPAPAPPQKPHPFRRIAQSLLRRVHSAATEGSHDAPQA